jgi:hypothetical protein
MSHLAFLHIAMFAAESFVHFSFISIDMFSYVISEKFLEKVTRMFFLSLKNFLKVPTGN